MSVLGTVSIYIPKGATVGGIAILGVDRKPIGGTGVVPVRPAEGDTIHVEFLETPDKDGGVR